MRACPWPMVDLLPHDPPLVLLDRVSDWDDAGVSAEVTVRPDTLFAELGQGVPAHIGIEWMAQACGAFAGLTAKTAGAPVRIGFLLGTRDFVAERSWFVPGETLTVSARQVFLESPMAVFDCRIDSGAFTCARARLTVYQPDENAVQGTLP